MEEKPITKSIEYEVARVFVEHHQEIATYTGILLATAEVYRRSEQSQNAQKQEK